MIVVHIGDIVDVDIAGRATDGRYTPRAPYCGHSEKLDIVYPPDFSIREIQTRMERFAKTFTTEYTICDTCCLLLHVYAVEKGSF